MAVKSRYIQHTDNTQSHESVVICPQGGAITLHVHVVQGEINQSNIKCPLEKTKHKYVYVSSHICIVYMTYCVME